MKKKSTIGRDQSALENYLVYGLHIPNRRIYFGAASATEGEPGDQSDFGHCSVALAVRAIDLMVEMSSQPIEIHMTSYGGDPYFMLALMDKILESPVKFKFYGRGRIASSATWIMAICDERYLSEDTIIMTHNGSTTHSENEEIKVTDATILAQHDEDFQSRLNQVFADNSRMPKEFWDAIVKRDCYLSAKEVVMLGLADEIIPHKKRAAFRKKRMEALSNNPPATQLSRLVSRLLKRTRMDNLSEIKIHIPKEEFEAVQEYDHTVNELEKLGVETPETPTEDPAK